MSEGKTSYLGKRQLSLFLSQNTEFWEHIAGIFQSRVGTGIGEGVIFQGVCVEVSKSVLRSANSKYILLGIFLVLYLILCLTV